MTLVTRCTLAKRPSRNRPSALTFACDVWAEPLRGVVVEEALGVGEPHREVARVARILEHRLEGKMVGVGRAVVGRVLHEGRVHAVD